MTDDDKPRLEIDWLRAAGGALAAVSTAVLLSTLGAAGTLIGAAVGSFALTVTSALYTQGLARSKHRLTVAQRAAQQHVGSAQSQVLHAEHAQKGFVGDQRLAEAELHLDEAQAELETANEEAGASSWRQRFVLLPWKKIVIVAVGSFLAAMLVITAFELIAGRTVSSITGGSDSTGGTSISKVTGKVSKDDKPKNDRDGEDKPAPDSDPTSTDGPSDAPSQEPSTAPSDAPTSEPDAEPNPEPTPAPTDAPPTDPGQPDPVPVPEVLPVG